MHNDHLRELVATLRERYAHQEVPPCRLCGGKLSVQAAGGGRATVWACGGYTERDLGNGEFERVYAPGRSFVDQHYSDSRYEQYRHGDRDVLDLCDIVEKEWQL